MALRLTCDYQSRNGEDWKIEIYDANYIGAVLPFEIVTTDGAIISNDGGQNIFKRLYATTVTFTILVNENQGVIDYINELDSNNETDNIVRLYRDGVLVFRGYSVLETHKIQDDTRNRVYKYVASCGISRLRDIQIDFSTIFGASIPDFVSCFEVIKTAFKQSKILALYDNGGGSYDSFMRMRLIHVEDGSIYQVVHPLKVYSTSPKAFANDKRIYVNADKAIEYWLNAFNSKLHYRDGQFCFENIWTQKYRGGPYWEIKEDGADSFDQQNYDVSVGYSVNGVIPGIGNTISKLRPPRVINLKFEGGGSNNIAKEVLFYRNSGGTNIGDTFRLGYIFQLDKIFKIQLITRREIEVPINWDNTIPINNWIRYKFEIKVGNYYLRGSNVSLNFSWLTVDDSVLIAAATNSLTLLSNPSDGQTVSIGGKVWTYRNILTTNDGDVQIMLTTKLSLIALRKAINKDGVSGVDYSNETTEQNIVTASDGIGNTMDIEAVEAGVKGNDIVCDETVNGSWATPTMEGGEPYWTLTPSEFILYSDGYFGLLDAFEITDFIPGSLSDGTIELKCTAAEFVEFGSLNVISDFNFETQDFVLLANQKANTTTVEYNTAINANNTEILKLVMQIGDVEDFYDTEQRIYYTDNMGVIKLSSQWNQSGRNLQEVNISEINDIRGATIQLYSGIFWDQQPRTNKMHGTSRIIHRSKAFIFLKYTHRTGADEISGNWYEFNGAIVGATAPPVLPDYPVTVPDSQILKEDFNLPLPSRPAASVQINNNVHPELTRLSQSITIGDNLTLLNINAAVSKMYAGDSVILYDPASGKKEKFTLSQNVEIGDSTISITAHAFAFSWPQKSLVAIDPQFILQNALTINNVITKVYENIRNDYLDVIDSLPDPANYTVEQYRQLVRIKGDAFYFYKSPKTKFNHFTIDVSGANNKILFNDNQRGADLEITIIQTT